MYSYSKTLKTFLNINVIFYKCLDILYLFASGNFHNNIIPLLHTFSHNIYFSFNGINTLKNSADNKCFPGRNVALAHIEHYSTTLMVFVLVHIVDNRNHWENIDIPEDIHEHTVHSTVQIHIHNNNWKLCISCLGRKFHQWSKKLQQWCHRKQLENKKELIWDF